MTKLHHCYDLECGWIVAKSLMIFRIHLSSISFLFHYCFCIYIIYVYMYVYLYILMTYLDVYWYLILVAFFFFVVNTSYLLSIFSIANTIASVCIHTWVCVAKKTWTRKLLMKRAHETLRIGSDEFTNSVRYNSMVSCQKGPTRHAYAWQIGPFWQDTLEL